jgi:hypothetical protein
MIDYSLSPSHTEVFQSKLLAGNGGKHIFNLRLSANRDNGTIRGLGAVVAFDEYAEANAPATFAAKIVGKSARGNWYVEVTEDADAVLVAEVPIFTSDDVRFQDMKLWYNKSGETVRAYGLAKHDIFEVSKEAFTTTPTDASIGKAVSANAASGKLVIAS